MCINRSVRVRVRVRARVPYSLVWSPLLCVYIARCRENNLPPRINSLFFPNFLPFSETLKQRLSVKSRFLFLNDRKKKMDGSFLAVLFAVLISALGIENGVFLGVVLLFLYYPMRCVCCCCVRAREIFYFGTKFDSFFGTFFFSFHIFKARALSSSSSSSCRRCSVETRSLTSSLFLSRFHSFQKHLTERFS